MRIAFLDLREMDYTTETPYQRPLGGTQSALCYLAETLAKLGHQIFLFNHTSRTGLYRGVNCLKWEYQIQSIPLDVVIIVTLAGFGLEIKRLLNPDTLLIYWMHEYHLTEFASALKNPAERNIYDGMVFVSNWQQEEFYHYFGINLERSCVIRNAIAPAFTNMFATNQSILTTKSRPPILAYTSPPDRGLQILIDIFPQIRQAIPGTRLKVFSSIKIYQFSDDEDEQNYGVLYRQCRETEGIEYLGSIAQPQLAQELRSVSILTYPSTCRETSCIAVMEAIASGCLVVTSHLAALPETTANFASLIPLTKNITDYQTWFLQETINLLHQFLAGDARILENYLQHQVAQTNRLGNWSFRAQQWLQWLNHLLDNQTINY